MNRREFVTAGTLAAALSRLPAARGQGTPAPASSGDRVFVVNEDSNTVTVIDPSRNDVETTINLTSFDEDPRPPYRYANGEDVPTHADMVKRPLYHGCVLAHGAAATPDQTTVAVCGRGSSNVYLLDTVRRRVRGNTDNPLAGATTNAQRISSGILVGREPFQPAYTRNGVELWVPLRGEDRIALVDHGRAIREVSGMPSGAVRAFLQTVYGPAHVGFVPDGSVAFIASSKVRRLDVLRVNADSNGYSRPQRAAMVDLGNGDAMTSALGITPDGSQAWLAHPLDDAIVMVSARPPFRVLGMFALGAGARPMAVQFVDRGTDRFAYVGLGRTAAGGEGTSSSEIAIVTRAAATPQIVRTFASQGRGVQAMCINPAGTRLYVAHAGDEATGSPYAGETVCAVFDISEPQVPQLLARIPLGTLNLPSGELRNKSSASILYVRPAMGLRLG